MIKYVLVNDWDKGSWLTMKNRFDEYENLNYWFSRGYHIEKWVYTETLSGHEIVNKTTLKYDRSIIDRELKELLTAVLMANKAVSIHKMRTCDKEALIHNMQVRADLLCRIKVWTRKKNSEMVID